MVSEDDCAVQRGDREWARVLILQEYIPQYRASFFEELIKRAAARNIVIQIAHGRPSRELASRRDAGFVENSLWLRQRELQIFGKRVVIRRLPRAIWSTSDLVIMEQARRNLDVYRLLLSRRRAKRIALWGHGRDFVESKAHWSANLLDILTRRAAHVFVYTKGGGEYCRSIGVAEARLTVVQNAIDTSELYTALASAQARVSHATADRSVTALFVGGLDESKRIGFLIDAADEIRSRLPEFQMIVAGAGEDERLIQVAAASRPWLHYVGPVGVKEKATLLSKCSVLLMPGRVGLIAVDSIVSGVPIVTTDHGKHAPEMDYLDRDSDVIVTSDGVTPFAIAALNLMTAADKRDAMSARLLAKRDNYSIETMAERFLSGIEDALKAVNPSSVAGSARARRDR